MDRSYLRQAELVVRCIPAIAAEPSFAIKGGTAINLFELNLPRLSVDIDLTFLPVTDRATATREINAALQRISERLKARGIDVRMRGTDVSRKLGCFANGAEIKIEPNFILRGNVYPVRRLERLLDFMSLSNGSGAFGIPIFDDLPAIRWKRRNLDSLRKSNPAKFALQRDALARLLEKGKVK